MVADGHMNAPRGVRRSTPNVVVGDAGIANAPADGDIDDDIEAAAGDANADAVVGYAVIGAAASTGMAGDEAEPGSNAARAACVA